MELKNIGEKQFKIGKNDGLMNSISLQEKQEIRHLLLESFGDESKQLYSQLAVSISKIARIDFPLDWYVICIHGKVMALAVPFRKDTMGLY